MKTLPAEKAIEHLNTIFNSLSSPLEWICHTGLKDNWNIVVREDYAKDKNIRDISDLEKCQDLILGCEYDFFARPNGYNLLTSYSGYGLRFEKTVLLDHAKAYDALDNQEVNVIDGFTTDPQQIYKDSRYRVLEDNEQKFGDYFSSIVARKTVLDTNSNVKKILNLLQGQISQKEMSNMIQKADRYHDSRSNMVQITAIDRIVDNFLRKKGLYENDISKDTNNSGTGSQSN